MKRSGCMGFLSGRLDLLKATQRLQMDPNYIASSQRGQTFIRNFLTTVSGSSVADVLNFGMDLRSYRYGGDEAIRLQSLFRTHYPTFAAAKEELFKEAPADWREKALETVKRSRALAEGMGILSAPPVVLSRTLDLLSQRLQEVRTKLLLEPVDFDMVMGSLVEANTVILALERMSRYIPGFKAIVDALRPQVDELNREMGSTIRAEEKALGPMTPNLGIDPASVSKTRVLEPQTIRALTAMKEARALIDFDKTMAELVTGRSGKSIRRAEDAMRLALEAMTELRWSRDKELFEKAQETAMDAYDAYMMLRAFLEFSKEDVARSLLKLPGGLIGLGIDPWLLRTATPTTRARLEPEIMWEVLGSKKRVTGFGPPRMPKPPWEEAVEKYIEISQEAGEE